MNATEALLSSSASFINIGNDPAETYQKFFLT